MKAKLLAQAHSERGQSRFCQLMLWAKNVHIPDPETLLLALTISAGQFVESHTEHARVVLDAAKEIGIPAMKWWWTYPIQNVLHRRKLAQVWKTHTYEGKKLDFCPDKPSRRTENYISCGDPRIKWAGWRYQENLGITFAQAFRYNLTDIVGDKLSRKIKAYHNPKTDEQLRAQTRNATQFRIDRADRLAIVAQDMRGNGYSVQVIANHLKRSIRTVYSYLHRFVQFRSQERSYSTIQAQFSDIRDLKTVNNEINSRCLATPDVNSAEQKARSAKFPSIIT